MTNLRKTALAALAVTVLATSGLFATPGASSAMSTVRVAPVEASTQDVVEVGNRRHRRGRHHWRHRHGYRHHCFFVERKFWDEYRGRYFWKPVKICR